MKLLEPIEINGLQLANRVVMLATHLGYCEADGMVNDRVVEFYRERARYHPGLIIVGGCYTEHLGKSGPTMIGISDEAHIPGLRRLTDTIHEHDVPVCAQLYHAGRYSHPIFLGEQPVSASAVPSRLFKSTPRPLSKDEVKTTVTNFGIAARRAKEAGFDAVEIIGSAGYLINQFLARCTNKRKDEYNGQLRNRARFALEVIQSVRQHVGSEFPIFYRMSGEDFVEGGTTLEDNMKLAPLFADAGVDVFNVTGGWHETRVPQTTMDVPRGHFAYLAESIAETVDVPVVACNRINSPTIAERILERGKVQLIGMSRAFIADPEIIDKTRSGRQKEIRHCIACNLGCLDRVFTLEPVICAINPIAGFETERKLGPKISGSVAVVGGGAAGMEAARVLALRGAKVTLFEKEKHLGGLLKLLSRVPTRGEYASYITHMLYELQRLGVDIRTGIEATAENLARESFDRLVLAPGLIASAPPIDGVEGPHVTSAYDVLSTRPEELGRVAIIGANSIACHVSLFVSHLAKEVHVFTLGEKLGTDIGLSSRWVVLKNMRERAVKIHDENISQITEKYIVVEQGGAFSMIPAETVVVATSPEPRVRLGEKLDQKGIPYDVIGSAAGPRNLLEIVHHAFLYANTVDL